MKNNINKKQFKPDDQLFNVPKPEEIYKDTYYTLTVSPIDTIHYDQNTDDDFNADYLRVCQEMHRLILRYQDIAEIILYTEISRKGRVHFHGTIKFKDIYKSYFILLYRLSQIGSVEIDTISLLQQQECKPNEEDGLANWIAYCTKLYEIMPKEACFHNMPIVSLTKGGAVKHKQTFLK